MESGQSSSEPQKARGFIQRMNEEIKTEMDDELRPEYDLPKLLKDGVRGKYAERYQAGTNLVLLAPDVAQAFPNDEAVNEALRLVMQLAKLQIRTESEASKA
jgi:hypothetical protein